MSIPPRPDEFHPQVPPPGFEMKLISFWRDRPTINPRLQLVHTNAASRMAGIDSIYNWANQQGSGHTIPHCQIQRDGSGYVLLPSDRKGIANYLAADFSLGFETQDTGTLDDPTISAFTDEQAEAVAVACAYYSVLHDIPLAYPATWDGSGTASHTEPFGYPLWTNSLGKSCPGSKKKAQVRNVVLPQAREIAAAWTAPEPEPPAPTPTKGGPDMIAAIAKTTDAATLVQFEFRGPIYTVGETAQHDVTVAEVFGRGAGKAYDIVNRNVVSWASPTNQGSWGAVKATHTAAQVRALMNGD